MALFDLETQNNLVAAAPAVEDTFVEFVEEVESVAPTTHSNDWALDPLSDPSSELFMKHSKAAMRDIINTYGSAFGFLKFHLKLDPEGQEALTVSLKLRNAYAQWLWEEFPESCDTAYHHHGLLPSVTEADMGNTPPLCVHVTSLGYDRTTSMKQPVGEDVFLKLTERYILDGFITSSEPGWVVQPDTLAHLQLIDIPKAGEGFVPGQLGVCSLGYIKFWGRMCSLHALLLWVMRSGINLKEQCPVLYDSIANGIFVHHVPQDSRTDEALLNLVKSTQGSIRRSPNTISIVLMMFNLKLQTQWADFIRKWNKRAGSQGVVGKRASAMKFIMDLAPEDVIQEIFRHNERMPSGQGVWTDDNLSSKKLWPGSSFPCKSRKWAPRLRVTKESLMLWVKHVQNEFEAKPSSQRKKPDMTLNIHTSELASAAWGLAQEVMTLMPIKETVLQRLSLPPA